MEVGPTDPQTGPVCPLVGWLAGRSVCHNFIKGGGGIYTYPMLLSEHLFQVYKANIAFESLFYFFLSFSLLTYRYYLCWLYRDV